MKRAIIVAAVLSAGVAIHMPGAQAQSQPVGVGISTQAQPMMPGAIMQTQSTAPSQPMPGAAGTATNTAELQALGSALNEIGQKMQPIAKQVQNDPQSTAMLKLMYAQAETMGNVINIMLKQAQVGASLPLDAKTKVAIAQKQAAAAAPTIVEQQKQAIQALIELQQKLMGASKTQAADQAKQQLGALVPIQSGLLQVQSRLYIVMLAEMAK